MDMLLVIDGHSLMYRAFYALPLMNDSQGRYTNAVLGFWNMLLKGLEMTGATHAAVALDMHAPTFRHQEYEDYKAGRAPMPEELRPQFDTLRATLEAARIPYLQLEGYEADDILGTLSRMAEEAGMPCRIVTGDRDSLQLVTENTHVLLTQKGLSLVEDFDPARLMEYWNVTPAQVPDLKGMMGDASDHIPGIPGVGEKTAMKLIGQFGSLDGLYERLDEVTGKLREKIEAGRESAYFSRDLATIDRNVPIGRDLASCRLTPFEETDLTACLESFELMSLARKIAPAAPLPALPSFKTERLLTDAEVASVLSELPEDARTALDLSRDLTFAAEGGDTVWCLPIRTDLLGEGWLLEAALAALSPLYARPLVLHGAKAWMHRLRDLSLPLPVPAFDTEIAAYLLDSTAGKYDAEALVRKAAGDRPMDAGGLLILMKEQEEELRRQGQWELFTETELPLVSVLFDMEETGFRVDREELARQGAVLEEKMRSLQAGIYELSGETFNIQSPKQLGEVLFEKLGLPHGKKTKTGYSTAADILEDLAGDYPIVRMILDYRQAAKLMGTYIEGLQALIDPRTSRIHTRFNQTQTATGRLSSAEPNLQNIPIRMPEGKLIRRAFLPREGCVLVDADYSQIELRVLAHMAGDPSLTEAFLRGEDIHAHTASEVFHVPMETLPHELRSAAKAVNFGIIYGISDFGLSRQLDIPVKQAGEYIRQYLETYSSVSGYMKQVVEEGRKNGYVETLFHRRRPMPDLRSRDYNRRSAAERMAMNAPIQGTAADIMKIAMVSVARALKDRGMETKMILQVHDELVLEAPENERDAAAELLVSCMRDAAQLAVPLQVEVTWGNNWYEAKP